MKVTLRPGSGGMVSRRFALENARSPVRESGKKDVPENMQWQTKEAATIKDRMERGFFVGR